MAVIFFTGYEWGPMDSPGYELLGNAGNAVNYGGTAGTTWNYDVDINAGITGTYCVAVNYSNVNPGNTAALHYFPARDEIYGQFYVFPRAIYNLGYLAELIYKGTTLMTFYTPAYDKRIRVYSGRGTSGTLYGTTTNEIKCRWQCVEFHLKLHNSEGIIEIKFDGESQMVYNGNTNIVAGGMIDKLRLGSHTWNNGNICYENVVIYDTTGTKNNSWVNGAKVLLLTPNASGDYTEWTPSTGQNFDAVNDLPLQTTYVRATVADRRDSYNMSNLPTKYSKIIAIRPDYMMKRNSDEVNKITPFIITNGSRYDFDTLNVPYMLDLKSCPITETNPITHNDFTTEEINNIQVGLESES